LFYFGRVILLHAWRASGVGTILSRRVKLGLSVRADTNWRLSEVEPAVNTQPIYMRIYERRRISNTLSDTRICLLSMNVQM
jgi:hypothetical protein